MYMNARSHIVALILFFAALFLLPAPRALAQDSQDDQPHITPRNSPTPTPTSTATPKPAASEPPAQKPAQKKDQYDRPPFPGDAPGTNPTGGSVTGESSSKDSQIDTDSHSAADEPAAPAEDETVLRPWDPHKAAKDVEVGQYYLKLKNYRAALERFNHALTYKPNDAEAIFGLATTQEKLDLLDQADKSYRRYLSILPYGPKSKEAQEGLKRIGSSVVE